MVTVAVFFGGGGGRVGCGGGSNSCVPTIVSGCICPPCLILVASLLPTTVHAASVGIACVAGGIVGATEAI